MTVEHLLQQIASDNRSGAAEIVERAAELFDILATQATEFATVSQARCATLEACVRLVRAQPCMAPLINLAGAVIRAGRMAATSHEALKSAAAAASEFSDHCRRAAASTAAHAVTLIADGTTVFTHSRSSTVLGALIAAHDAGTNVSVIATESRPMLEGRTLAEALAGQGISVTLIPDAAAALILSQVDCVLVGADRITPGAALNKIGTRMIALAAKERRLPIYALADSSKFIRPLSPDQMTESEREPAELWPDAPPGVLILNRYFEETPIGYFTGIVTEDGLLTPDAASRRGEAAVMDESLIAALSSDPAPV